MICFYFYFSNIGAEGKKANVNLDLRLAKFVDLR
jgi:hypothetical protein